MVSVAISKLGYTNHISVELGAIVNCSTIETCCRSCHQQYAALLETCLCTSTSRSRHSRASAPWYTAIHQSWHVASQQSWSKSSRLPHLRHDTGACVSSTNPRYWRGVAAAVCWDMGWNSVKHGGWCDWSMTKETDGSVCPCRKWSFWTLAVTLLAWHSSCHPS